MSDDAQAAINAGLEKRDRLMRDLAAEHDKTKRQKGEAAASRLTKAIAERSLLTPEASLDADCDSDDTEGENAGGTGTVRQGPKGKGKASTISARVSMTATMARREQAKREAFLRFFEGTSDRVESDPDTDAMLGVICLRNRIQKALLTSISTRIKAQVVYDSLLLRAASAGSIEEVAKAKLVYLAAVDIMLDKFIARLQLLLADEEDA